MVVGVLGVLALAVEAVVVVEVVVVAVVVVRGHVRRILLDLTEQRDRSI